MDAPIPNAKVEVIDTVGDMTREIRDLRIKVSLLTQDTDTLRATCEHLKQRKAHYKGIVERAHVVLNAARLLDVGSIGVEVLADALEGDRPDTIDGRRR
jgi:hypothetical protein